MIFVWYVFVKVCLLLICFAHKNAKISGHTDNCLEICGAVQEGKAVEFQIE